MNKTIKELNEKLNTYEGNISDIESQLQLEWNKVFEDSTKLRDNIALLEQSNEYGWNEGGEIMAWERFYDLNDYKECAQYLENYLSDQGVGVDWDNRCLTSSQGGCIIINEDGDVYDSDSGKFFIAKSDYCDDNGDVDETKCNALIEAYMERTGCFPRVFQTDHYGNVFAVDTKKGS